MKIRGFVGALIVALALLVCGCSGGVKVGTNTFEDKQVDAEEVAKATPVVDGWVQSGFDYFAEHSDQEDGVVMQLTGMITEGSESGKESMLTLVSPELGDASDESGDIEHITLTDNDQRVDVYFEDPVEMTKWLHLTSVKGMAFKDGENRIVMLGAREVED